MKQFAYRPARTRRDRSRGIAVANQGAKRSGLVEQDRPVIHTATITDTTERIGCLPSRRRRFRSPLRHRRTGCHSHDLCRQMFLCCNDIGRRATSPVARGPTEVDAVNSLHQGLDLRAVAVPLGLRDGWRERDDDGLDLKQAVVPGIGLGARGGGKDLTRRCRSRSTDHTRRPGTPAPWCPSGFGTAKPVLASASTRPRAVSAPSSPPRIAVAPTDCGAGCRRRRAWIGRRTVRAATQQTRRPSDKQGTMLRFDDAFTPPVAAPRQQRIGHFGQISADHAGLSPQRTGRDPAPGDERRLCAGGQSPGDIPGVRRDQAQRRRCPPRTGRRPSDRARGLA